MSDTLNRRYEAGQRAYYENHETGGQHFRAIVDAADAAVNYEAAQDVLEAFLHGDGPDDTYAEMLNRAIDVALGRQSNE